MRGAPKIIKMSEKHSAEATLVCIEIPRSDTNEGCEDEVTVTSGIRTSRKHIETDKRRRHPLEAKTKS